VGCKLEDASQNGARIDSRSSGSGELRTDSGRVCCRAVTSEELPPVGRVARYRLAHGAEADPLGQLRVEEVLRVDRAKLGVERREHLMLRVLTKDAEGPFHVSGDRDPTTPIRRVGNS
jgi:hypothetical protein